MKLNSGIEISNKSSKTENITPLLLAILKEKGKDEVTALLTLSLLIIT
jgi:hypothetical protein